MSFRDRCWLIVHLRMIVWSILEKYTRFTTIRISVGKQAVNISRIPCPAESASWQDCNCQWGTNPQGTKTLNCCNCSILSWPTEESTVPLHSWTDTYFAKEGADRQAKSLIPFHGSSPFSCWTSCAALHLGLSVVLGYGTCELGLSFSRPVSCPLRYRWMRWCLICLCSHCRWEEGWLTIHLCLERMSCWCKISYNISYS